MFESVYHFFSCYKRVDIETHEEIRVKYMRAKRLPFAWKARRYSVDSPKKY